MATATPDQPTAPCPRCGHPTTEVTHHYGYHAVYPGARLNGDGQPADATLTGIGERPPPINGIDPELHPAPELDTITLTPCGCTITPTELHALTPPRPRPPLNLTPTQRDALITWVLSHLPDGPATAAAALAATNDLTTITRIVNDTGFTYPDDPVRGVTELAAQYTAALARARDAERALAATNARLTRENLIATCDQCPHLLAHHGPHGCQHTPGHDDTEAHPSYYTGEPSDCACTNPRQDTP